MKWQKARQLPSDDPDDRRFSNRPFWVCDLHYHPGGVGMLNLMCPPGRYYMTNLIDDGNNNQTLVVTAGSVELLGGDDAFADDVPRIRWTDFIRENQ